MWLEKPMGGRRRVPVRTRKIHEQINLKDKNIPSAVSAFQILHCDNKEAVPQLVALGYVYDYKSKTLFEQAVLLLTCHLSGAHTSHRHHFVLSTDYSTACEGVLKAGGLSWRTRFGPCCLRSCLSSLHCAEETELTGVWKLLLPPVRGEQELPHSSKWWAVSLPWRTCSMTASASGLQMVLP